MTKTALKHTAQDELLGGMANVILAHNEGAYGEPDAELIDEMLRQSRRIMKMLGVDSYPGLGTINN